MLAKTSAIPLGTPDDLGGKSLNACIRQRRSIRSFSSASLAKDEVGKLLWAGQGVTGWNGERTVPSAGALYPLVVGIVAQSVASIPAGVYRYFPLQHRLTSISAGEYREGLVSAALGQQWIGTAPAVLFIAGAIDRTAAKHGDRRRAYVLMEAGHAAENMMLQAVALDLGTTMVGAFSDSALTNLLALGPGETPLCLIPVGKP